MAIRMYGKSLWFAKSSICLGVHYYPMWQRGGLCFHENGARKQGECLDVSLVIWKLDINLTIWGLRRIAWITKHIPRPERSGYTIGFVPLGAK